MKFNHQLFIEETSGSLEAALSCIDDLVTALNGYFEDDAIAEKQIISTLKDKQIGEYLNL